MVQTRIAQNVLTSAVDIKKEALSHFQRFLQSQHSLGEEVSVDTLRNLLTYRCPTEACTKLVAPVSGQEIQDALHSLPNDKVLGLDGFTKEFFVAAWSVIGRDFITAIQFFFLLGFLPTGINATILTLIPKTETAQKMKDYRPITYCNLIYKVISKVLTTRLKVIFPDAVEAKQSVFIEERLLLEIILLTPELINRYHKATALERCPIKFDISKAFDKWSFITTRSFSALRADNWF